jgi:hypothetical protein
MTEEKKELETIEVVYIGRRYYENRKTFGFLFAYPDDIFKLNFEDVNYQTIDSKALGFDAKSKFTAYIGNRYTLPITRDAEGKITGYYLSSLKHVAGSVNNFVHKSIWVELDKIVTHVKESERHQKKIRDNTASNQAVSHLQWVYKQLPPGHRKAFLISLMIEIERSTR